jgi:drug/metabolite transporter (DMT)-like permease
VTIALALASGLMWGAADFFGGSASRRIPALLVVLVSQAAGLAVALATAALSTAFSTSTGYLPWALGAGLAGAGALVLYYRALAIGTMGVVAPIASLGVVVPVVIGLFAGALPTALCLAGIVVAIAGVVATAGPSRGDRDAKPGHALSILMAIGSAAGFGLVLYAISRGAQFSPVMTMVAMRVMSVPVLLAIAFATLRGRSGGPRPPGQAAWSGALGTAVGSKLIVLVSACGVLDVGANLLFGIATTSGALAIVAVLGSMYPAGTVLLARFVDGERMSRVQNAGVVAALAGVAMIAVGS